MKTFVSNLKVIIIIILSLSLSGCDEEYFDGEFQDIHGKWVIRSISGGLSGRGITPGFDYMVIERKNSYSLFKDNSIISKGKIKIQNQSPEELSILFAPETDEGLGMISSMEQSLYIRNDTLILSEECSDCYSYLFVRCEVYNDDSYFQLENTLDFLDIAKHSIGFKKRYTSIFFLDENFGFATCYDGSILKTINGGKNWSRIDLENTLPLNDICFINELVGYAVGGDASCGGTGCVPPGGIILKTVDGGDNWIKQDINSVNAEFNVIRFVSETKGFAFGLGVNLVTYNSGDSWEIYQTNFGGFIYELQFVNENVGFVSGIKGIFFKTIDGGESWINLSLDISYQLYSVAFLSEEVGYLGSYKKIMKTTDGGLSWNFIENAPSDVTSINIKQEDELIVFGSRTYSEGNCKEWNANLNFLISGDWQGDSRISSIITPFRLNDNKYFTINRNDELLIITIN